jgi:transposase-like protein
LRDTAIAQQKEEIMPKRLGEEDLASVVDIVRQSTGGARRSDIAKALKRVPQRTLQYWLKSLVEDGRLTQEGKGPAARYLLPAVIEEQKETRAPQARAEQEKPEVVVPLSTESKKICEYLQQPSGVRKAVGYNRLFLDGYRPNTTFYLSPKERAHLAEVGKTKAALEAAGTYAKHILNRLLIDLSWNSSNE